MSARADYDPQHTPMTGYAMPRKIHGFTLMELMITVAVVAILAAIAYPSYQEQIRKSHRAQAKADLVEYAGLAERHFTVNNAYTGFSLPTTKSPREDGSAARYTLSTSNVTASTYTLTATPTGAQSSDKCGNLSITHTGLKSKTGTAALSECW